MLKYDKVEIVGNGKTLNYYKVKGYDIKCGLRITIDIKDLIKTSAIKVECFCDICDSLNEIKYYNYVGNIERNNLYRCNECSKLIRIDKNKNKFSNTQLKEEIILKRKNTNIKKYGFDSYAKTEEFKKKIKETLFIKYGDEKYNNIEKNKKTCLDKLGVDSYFKSIDFKLKIKKIINEKYGCDNVFSNEEIKKKIKKTLIDRYGVDNPTKNKEIFDRAQRNSYKILRHEGLDITYQGTYELDFINFCIENNIKFQSGPTIDYILNDINRKYHSDFYIPDFNLICEIKSNWTYNRDLEENLAKKTFSKSEGYNFLFLIDKNYDFLKTEYLNLLK